MKNIAVLAGGYTSERQISLNSGSQILENIDRNLYNAYLVDVRKDGFFCIFNGKEYSVDLNKFAAEIEGKPTKFDYAYLALHGSPGEDGKVQVYIGHENLVNIMDNSNLTENVNAHTKFEKKKLHHRGRALRVRKSLDIRRYGIKSASDPPKLKYKI